MKNRLNQTLLVCCLIAVGCGGGDDLDSDTEARWAYLGFDRAIDRAMALGFDGFNAANSANIPEQTDDGDVGGTMSISGQVDQGSSNNKGMRLDVDVIEYADGFFDDPDTGDDAEEIALVYDTDPEDLPNIDLSLRNIPNGTFTGTLSGRFIISGDLDSSADFALALSGDIQEDPNIAGDVLRTPGTLAITGTVTSGDGTFDVDILR